MFRFVEALGLPPRTSSLKFSPSHGATSHKIEISVGIYVRAFSQQRTRDFVSIESF
jgi:hypothetical protein